MESWILLTDILLLLGGAFIFGIVAQRLNQSAIIGYLLAGVVLGPFLFHAEPLMHLAELGVALLLFTIGLEFSFTRLRRLGPIALGGGILQITSTMVLVTFALCFFLAFKAAIALGAMIALSSTAVVMRILVDRTEVESPRGRNSLGILLLQDIAVVPLVLMVTMMGQAGEVKAIWLQVLEILLGAAGLIVLFYVLFYIVVPRILFSGTIHRNRDLVVLLAIISAVGSSWLAHEFGLSPALGAFIAGMMLAESPFATQIRADIGSIRTLFVTLFFATIGLLLDPGWMVYNAHWVLLALVLIVFVKTAVIFGVARVFRRPPAEALATGITLAQVGEFSFVLATASRDLDLITPEIFSMIVSVTIVSIFISTYMVNKAPALARGLLVRKAKAGEPRIQEDFSEGGRRSDRILIIGFGPAGRRVADALIGHKIRPEVIEMNPGTGRSARDKGLSVHMGDAVNEEVLVHAGINNACLVIITIPDPRMTISIIETVKRLADRAVVVARCRYHIYKTDMEKAGAEVVADEENMVGMHLAEAVVHALQNADSEEMACALGLSGV
ncbi:MAG: cation:proton antiporter [Desulfobacteraceae bacterium]|nr:cation:proton antiporter [Desulfobacteraceae bacterium]